MEGPRQSRSQSPIRPRSFKDTGQTKDKDTIQSGVKDYIIGKTSRTRSKSPQNALPENDTRSKSSIDAIRKDSRSESPKNALQDRPKNAMLNNDKNAAPNKAKDAPSYSKTTLSARSLTNIPLPKKANQLPRWSNSTYSNILEKSSYHVACESLWAKDFVILPNTNKIRLARLATFSTRLRSIIAMLLKADVESNNPTMDAGSLSDMLTLDDIEMPDHSGWMVDLSVNPSRRCWCVLADMVLCVFPDRTSERAVKVIMLPGLEVKAIVYKSARQEMLPQGSSSSNTSCMDTVGKTITGMLRYQVLLSDPCLGAEHVFGIERQDEVDRWVTLFKVAVNLDVDVFTDSESDTNDNGNSFTSSVITNTAAKPNGITLSSQSPPNTKSSEKEPETKQTPNGSSSEFQRSKSPSRIPRFRSASSPPDPEIILRKNKSSSYLPSLSAHHHRPMRAHSYHNSSAISKSSSKDSIFEESSKVVSKIPRSGASSIGSSSSLASDLGSQVEPSLVSRSADSSCTSSKVRSDDSSSTKLSKSTDFGSVEPPGSPLMNLLRKARGRAASMSSVKVDPPDNYRQRTSSTSSSASTSSSNSQNKNALGLRAKLVRKASTIKVRVFGTKAQQEVVMLSSLKDIKISGHLSVRNMLKWTTFWCVVNNGTLYSFYTQSPSDTPELALPLNECTVLLVSNEKTKRHLFKVSHLTTRSIHFAAKDNLELSKWVFALKRESKSSANRGSQNQAQLPSGGEFKKHIMGSQLSLDSSVSVQSQASGISRGSLMSENSTTSQSSSLSSLSQQSSSSVGSGGSPRDQTVPLGDLIHHSKCLSADGPQKVPELKADTYQNDHPMSEISDLADFSQSVCPAHGLQQHGITSQNGLHKKGHRYGIIEEDMTLEGNVDGPDSESTDLAVVRSNMNSAQSIDSGLWDSVSSDSTKSVASADSKNLTRSLQNVTVSLSAKYSTSPHKNNLHQPWRNDKTYQLHLLKAKISTLPDRPAIFNRHLPGPNNEGLLMVSDVGNDISCDLVPYNGSKVITAKRDQHKEVPMPSTPCTLNEDETITRKPSVKVKRRFSLKRMPSVRENRPKYTPKPDQELKSEPDPKPVDPIIQLKVEPTVEPKTEPKIKPESEPKVEPGTDLKPNMVEKPMEGGLEVNIDSRRRRSLSDGQLPVSIQQARDAQGQRAVNVRSHVEVAIPARDLSNVSRVGYLERKLDAEWISSWFVLKDNTLYQYAQPIDDVTQDVLQLPGYEVIPCLPAGDRHVFELIHAEQAALILSTDTVADCEMWMEAIHVATQKLTLDSLNLDMTNSVDQEEAKSSRERLEEEARRQWQKELLRLKKQQLLREVLLQKEELTRRQHQFARSKPSSLEGPFPGNQMEEELEEMDEQFLRERALLKQRKVSTQLKLEMVQKQMQASTLARTKTKRKGFKLKGLKSDKNDSTAEIVAITPDKDTLQNQLKMLTEELNNISHELELTERKSGSSSHLSTFSSSSHRRQNFALSSNASVDSESSRERTQSDFSETRMNRSFASDPNLLHPTPASSSLSLQRPDSVFSPDSLVLDQSDGGSRAQLHSSTKQGSNTDIPMIDDTPSPKDTPINNRSSRHSWDLGASTPFFLTTPPVSYNPSGSNRLGMGGQNTGLNKSCDFSVLQCQDGARTPYSSNQNTVPRSRNDTSCLARNEISATALAEIAAFEDLVQRKMQRPSPVQ